MYQCGRSAIRALPTSSALVPVAKQFHFCDRRAVDLRSGGRRRRRTRGRQAISGRRPVTVAIIVRLTAKTMLQVTTNGTIPAYLCLIVNAKHVCHRRSVCCDAYTLLCTHTGGLHTRWHVYTPPTPAHPTPHTPHSPPGHAAQTPTVMNPTARDAPSRARTS